MATIRMLLSWMPPALSAIIIAALGVFAIVMLAKLVKLILDALPFV